MKKLIAAGLFALLLPRSPLAAEAPGPPPPLVWDSLEKNVASKSGEQSARVIFVVKNASEQAVTIAAIEPSCGCTSADSPPLPWTLAPGAQGSVKVDVEIADKAGDLTKTIAIESTAGAQELTVKVHIPFPPPLSAEARRENQRLMQGHRQAVFENSKCSICHNPNLQELEGKALFQAGCAICHLARNRASVVPDLAVAREPRDSAYWLKWIGEGRAGTLMPAFAADHDGVLGPDKVRSVARYCLETFPGK